MKYNVLYTFRRCPFAIRARWALINTNQLVELREIDLKNKPVELIKISKKATVPVLKTPLNVVIDESLEIMIWCIRRSNMHSLIGENDKQKSEEIFSLIKTNDKIFKFHLDRFKYASRFNYQDLDKHRDSAMEILISLNNRLKKSFLNNGKQGFLVESEETIADWAIWPFVRQFRIADIKKFDENKDIKYLRNWLNYFLSHKLYPLVMQKNKIWNNQSENIIFGQKNLKY